MRDESSCLSGGNSAVYDGLDWIGLLRHCVGFGVSSADRNVTLLIPFCQSIFFENLFLDANK